MGDQNKNPDSPQESIIPAEGEKTRTIKGNEILEGFEKDLKIPIGSKLNDLYSLKIWKIRDEENTNIGWQRVEFPDDAPTQLFGLTKADLEAIVGKGVYLVRLFDKKEQDWARGYSKTIYVGISKEKSPHEVVQSKPQPDEESEKQEEEMDSFTQQQLEKLETKIEGLTTKIEDLNRELRKAETEQQKAENKATTIQLQKDEGEKRLESEKQNLIRERDEAKKDLETMKERQSERYTDLQADIRKTVEAKDKEIAELKEKLNDAKKDKDHFQYESLLAKAKGDGGGDKDVLMLKTLEQLTGLKVEQIKAGSEEKKDANKMLFDIFMRQLDIKADQDAMLAEAEAGERVDDSELPPSQEVSVTEQLGLGKPEQLLTGFIDPINRMFAKAGLILSHQDHIDKQLQIAKEEGIKEGAKAGVEQTAKKALTQIEKARQEGIRQGKEQAKIEAEKVKEQPPKTEPKNPNKKK